MLMHHQKIRYQACLLGVALVFGTVTAAIPAIAQTHSVSIPESLISQAPYYDRGVPSELYHDVSGVVKSLNGDQVQLDLGNGQEKTYKVPKIVQERYHMAPGSTIVLTVRDTDNYVVDVSLPE
ncbi:MAG TPA: hypothetical protein V6C57_04120 [Coleofasciculaceae cyanobacterium]